MSFSGLTGGCTIPPLFHEEYGQHCNLLRLFFLYFIFTSRRIAMEREQKILFLKKAPLTLNHLHFQLDKIGDPRILFSLKQESQLQRKVYIVLFTKMQQKIKLISSQTPNSQLQFIFITLSAILKRINPLVINGNKEL